MKKDDISFLLRKWIVENKWKIAKIAGIVCIYILVEKVYGNSMGGILYASVIIVFLFLCGCVFSFFRYTEKFQKIYELCHAPEISLDRMPISEGEFEKMYQELILFVDRRRAEIENECYKREAERNDYYQLWVHQIKTPIAAMRLLLQSQDLESELFSMEQQLFQIERYAEMALQYIRVESVSSDLLLKEYELQDIVKQAVKKYANIFIGKKLVLRLEPFSCKIVTDEKWLSFVMEQILSNALKYTKTGVISITYKENNILVITDTGIGICPEDLPRIFEKGYTGYNGRMDKKSTGIGLYLCGQVMNKLSHKIWVESVKDKGTSVYLDLSRKKYENIS